MKTLRPGVLHLATAAVVSMLLLPLLLTDVPPLLDYPNHLARFYLLAHISHDAVLARFYAVRLAVLPNVGTDVLAWLLMQVTSVHVAGRLVLAVTLLLPLLGCILYHRALHGPDRALWPLVGSVVASGGSFLLGFLNFSASLGAALCVAALWELWAGRRRGAARDAVLAAAGVAVLLCHAGGFLFLVSLVGSSLLARARAWDWRMAIAARTICAHLCHDGAVLCLPGLLLLAAPHGGVVGGTLWRPAAQKLAVLLAPMRGYEPVLDLVLCTLVLAAALPCLLNRTWGRVPLHVAVLTVGFSAAALLGPMRLGGAGFADMRFACMAWLLVFAGFRPAGSVRLSRISGVLIACLMAVRAMALAGVWQAHSLDLADLRTVMAPVQPGERVLVAQVMPAQPPGDGSLAERRGRVIVGLQRADTHVSGLLVPERRAFWPMLFDYPSQQPVMIRQPYDRLADAEEGPVDYHVLEEPAARLPAALRSWRQDYDWVLLMNAGEARDLRVHPPAGLLPPLAWTATAALFRISPGRG